MSSFEPRDQTLLPAAVWLVPAVMLLVALADLPYVFYTLLRWIVCGAFLCLAYQEHQLRGGASGWMVALAMMAILFNPLLPVHLTRDVWAPINAGSALGLVIHHLVRKRLATTATSTARSASSPRASEKPDAPRRERLPGVPARGTDVPIEQDRDLNALAAGSRLQECEIVRVLGAGSFGITYLAFDHHLNGPVAIKEYFYAGLVARRRGGAVVPSSTSNADGFKWGRARFPRRGASPCPS